MGAGVPVESGSRKGGSQDIDINIAPIIDCFVVLIAFLLVSASFLSIGILDAGIAAEAPANSKTAPPPVDVTVFLQKDRTLRVELAGKSTKKSVIKAKDGEWDFDAMTAELAEVKRKWPQVTGVTLTAADDVEYADVVRTMDSARKTLPGVLLGGF